MKRVQRFGDYSLMERMIDFHFYATKSPNHHIKNTGNFYFKYTFDTMFQTIIWLSLFKKKIPVKFLYLIRELY